MQNKKIFFTVGPAALYPKYTDYLQEAIDRQLGSISHRSKEFIDIYKFTTAQLRILMNIPADNQIMFTGSASEIWEKSIASLVEMESFHLVNGSFSSKYNKYSEALKKHAHSREKPMGEGFSYSEIEVPDYAELVCITQNETSTGVWIREPDIHKLKRSHAGKLFSIDMVSSAPIPDLDFNLIDSAFFSVQKNFGMPAGLGVWTANEACLEKSQILKNKNINIGAHHDLHTLWEFAKKNQTPATPNVMAIYILGKIAEDMNRIGIENIRKEKLSNARFLYSFFSNHPDYSVSVENEAHRSKTVIVIDTKQPSAEIIARLSEKNIIIGAGYGPKKESQIRISNFISNSTEDIEMLIDELKNL